MVKVNPGSSFEKIVVVKYLMLYTKFQGHRPLGFEKEDSF